MHFEGVAASQAFEGILNCTEIGASLHNYITEMPNL